MYRSHMATWFQSLVQRLPLKAIPSREQIRIAKEFAEQPDVPWCDISLRTVHAAVWAQAQHLAGDDLPAELLAALTWDRRIVKPAALHLMAVQRDPRLPDAVLPDLAALPEQTVYMLVEQPLPGEGDAFMNGVWMIRDVDHDTGSMNLLLLLDLVVGGSPHRGVLLQLPVVSPFARAVEMAVEEGLDDLLANPGALARREKDRSTLLALQPILAALHHTFIGHGDRLAELGKRVPVDELEFRLIDLAGGESQAAAGIFH